MREIRKDKKHALSREQSEAELDWFFGYAEGARRHDRVAMLPSHVAARTAVAKARIKAERLTRAIDACLAELPAPHGEVLRAVFTPRQWPKPVRGAFKHLSPIAVRLFGTTTPWPGRTSHQGLELAVAQQLVVCLRQDETRIESLRVEADCLFESAMQAYAGQRKGCRLTRDQSAREARGDTSWATRGRL